MVGIVGGQGTGLGHTNQAQLGNRGQFGSAQTGKNNERGYVNIATGNLLVQDRDALLIGTGDDISVIRTYNSLGKFRDDNNDSWWLNGYRRIENLSGLVNTEGSTVERIDQDGTITTFRYNSGKGLYLAQAGSGEFDTLSFTDNVWTWRDVHGHVSERYDGIGGIWRVTAHDDGLGNVTQYQYQGSLLEKIKNANGESVVFSYSGHNLTQEKILKSDGSLYSSTHYRYDSQNRLQQVLLDLTPDDGVISDGKVYATSYTYIGSTNLLESITQTDGYYQRYGYVEINGESRIASVTDAYNNVTRFDYDVVQRQTRVTDAYGNANVYRYNEQGQFLEVRIPAQGGKEQRINYSYDTDGNLSGITDGNGTTTYRYDNAGNLLEERDAIGNLTVYQYDNKNNRINKQFIPATGIKQQTTFVYDDRNQLRFLIDAAGGVVEYRYDAKGNRASEIRYSQQSFTPVAAEHPGLSHLMSWAAAQGAVGLSRTDFSYDERSQLRSRTQYLNLTTDGHGIKDGTESVTRYVYDVQGHLLSTIDPLNFQTSYSYDGLGRLLNSVSAQLQITSYSYDDVNRQILTRHASGRVDTEFYDQRNLLLKRVLGGSLETQWAYDALGRLVYSKDASGIEQLQIYDEAGYLSATVNGVGEVTEYRYNSLGQKVQTILRNGVLTKNQFQDLRQQLVQTRNALVGGAVPLSLAPPPVNPGPGETPVPTPVTNIVAKAWSATDNYLTGSYVNYQGQIYRARWDTQGATLNPADVTTSSAWSPIAGKEGYSLWQSYLTYQGGTAKVVNGATVFEGGEVVGYNGRRWQAQWYHQGVAPNTENGSPWKDLGPISGELESPVKLWQSTAEYKLGSIIEYQGRQYKARWDTDGSSMLSSDTEVSKVWRALPGKSGYSFWEAGITYFAGEKETLNGKQIDVSAEVVAYNGHLWRARWYHVGVAPASDGGSNPWEDLGLIGGIPKGQTGAPIIQTDSFYSQGSLVEYQGQQYVSRWDTAGNTLVSADPNDRRAWRPVPNSSGYSLWQSNLTYRAGETELVNGRQKNIPAEVVAYDGKLWRARFFNVGTTPADTNGNPWQLIGQVTVPVPPPISPLTSYRIALPILADGGDMVKYSVYDKAGRLGAEVNASGEVTEYRYNDAGQLVQTIVRAEVINITVLSDEMKAEALQIKANTADRISTRYYDVAGQLRATVDAEGSVTEYRYDAAGRKIASVNYAQRQPGAQPDWAINQVLVSNPGKDSIYYFYYDAQNQLIATINSEGGVTEYRYDQAHQQVQSRHYANSVSLTGLREGGQWDASVVKGDELKDEIFGQTYDAMGRVIAKSLRGKSDGLSEKYEYDQKTGLLISQTRNANSQLSSTTQQRYDEFGRVIASLTGVGSEKLKTNPANAEQVWRDYATTFTYDAANRKTSSTDANGYRTLYYYDQAGRLTYTLNALGEVQELRYNSLGQLTEKIAYMKRLNNLVSYAGGLTPPAFVFEVNALRDLAKDKSEQYKYDKSGNLEVATDGNGVQTRYSYNHFGEQESQTQTITDSRTVIAKTLYNKRGQVVERIADLNANPRSETIEYDSFGRVWRVKDGNGNIKETNYDRQGRVVEIRDIGTGESNTTSYDALDRILSKTDGSQQTTQYQYSKTADGWKVEITSPEGVKHALEKSASGEVLWESIGDVKTSYHYNADGQRIKTTDARSTNLKANTNDYDQAGRLSDSYDANGNQVHYDYDAANRLIRRTVYLADGVKLVTSTEYDALGRTIKSTDANGSVTSFEFDQAGQLLKQTLDPNGLKLVTKFAYDKRGKTLSIERVGDDGKNQLDRYEYDNLGRRTREYQGDILVHSYQYDKNNNLVARYDYPQGEAGLSYLTRMVYDSQNRLIYKLDSTGQISQTIYDSNGVVKQQLVFDQFASGNSNPILSASDVQSMVRGNPIVVVHNDYDKDGRLQSSTDAAGLVTSYDYDARGNITRKTLTDPRTPSIVRETRFAYDAANRLVLEIDTDGSVTRRVYDHGDNIVSQTQYATPLKLTGLGNVVDLATYLSLITESPADRTTRMAYDNANRLVYSVDAEGYVSYREYQGTRLVKQTQYATAVVVASADLATIRNTVKSDVVHDRVSQSRFDAAGNLLESTDALGYRESYTYNALGQKTSFTNKNGATWNYEYDQAGRLVKEIAPAVEVSEALVDGAGRLTGVVQRSWQRLATVLEYDALGNLSKRTEAAGSSQARSTRYDYDAQGRQIASYFPATGVYNPATNATELVSLSSAVDYDALGNATRNRDVAGNYSYKVYDAAGRVQYDIDAAGFVTEYKRNAYGEVIALTRYDQSHSAYLNYDNTKKQLVGFYARPATGSRTLSQTYDQSGRISQVSETLIHGGDSQGRLVIQSKVTDNRYNAFGELVSVTQSRTERQNDGSFIKGLDAVETRYAYDHRGQKVASLDAENYLTVMRYDGVGNLSEQVEFAERYQGAWDETGQAVRGMALKEGSKDRGMRYEYDANGRKLSESRLNAEFAVLSGIGRSEQNQHGTVLTRYAYDHLGNQILSSETEIDATRGNNSSTAGIARVTRTVLTSYDVLGRVLGKVEPGSGNDNKGVYSRYERDAYGNAVKIAQGEVLVQNQENGPPKLSGMVQLGQQQSLQAGEALYSANGRYQLLLQTDGNLVIYDSVTGTPTQPTAIWQSGTGAGSSGAESLRLTMQDDGNLVLYRGAAALWSSQTQSKGMMLRLSDAGQLELRDDAGTVRWTSSNAAQATGKERVSTARYNQAGKLEQQLDALNQLSRSGYDVYGNQVAQFKVVHKADGGLLSDGTTALVSMRYDHAGRLIESTQQTGSAQSEASTMSYRYNGYGELVEQRVLLNGQWQSLSKNDYDETGQVWRSRAQDGVTHLYLRDYLGRVVRDVSSQSLDLQTVSIPQLSDVASNANYISTVIRYNKLGQVTERSMPSNGAERQLTVTSVNHRLSYDVVGNVTAVSDTREESQPEFIEGSKKREGSWIGQNSIRLSLPDTGNWGDGDLRVSIVFNAGNIATPQLQQIDRILSVHAGQGDVTISWPNQSFYQSAAQDQITQISLAKKDSSGNWVTLGEIRNSVENGAAVAGATNLSSLHLSAPNNLDLEPVFEFRQIGSSQWESGRLTRFGKDYAFNPIQGRSSANPLQPETLAEGQYEYKMVYRHRLTGVLAGGSEGKFSVGYESERLEVAQLFVALYNRGPIASELENMATRLKSQSLADVAEQLLNSPPLAGKSAGEILSLVYRQAQGREPDQAGLDYWLKQWSGPGPAARGSVISDIIRNLSGMQQSDTVALNGAKLFNNKVQVALTYAWQLKGSDFTLAAQALGLVDSNGISQALALLSTRGVITQAEQQLQITQFYLLTHDRVPEAAGMEYFLKELKSKPENMEAQLTSIFNQSGLASLSAKDLAGVVLEQRLQWTNPDRKARLEVALSQAPDANAKMRLLSAELSALQADSSGSYETESAKQRLHNRTVVGLLNAAYLKSNAGPDAAAELTQKVTAGNIFSALSTIYQRIDKAQFKQMQISQAYTLLLNRAPEKEGYVFWQNQMQQDKKKQADLLNAIITDVLSSLTPKQLLQDIYSKVLGPANYTVSDDNYWLGELTRGNKGEVLSRLLDELQNWKPGNHVSEEQAQLFQLKNAYALIVANLGGDFQSSTRVFSSAQQEVNAMRLLKNVEVLKASEGDNAQKLLQLQLAKAETEVAAKLLSLQSAAAELAYQKTRESQAYSSYLNADLDLQKARDALNKAESELSTANAAVSKVAEMVEAAKVAVANANARVQIDNSIENQVALEKARIKLNEARYAEASAKSAYDTAKSNYDNKESDVATKQSDRNSKYDAWQTSSSQRIQAQSDYDKAQTDYTTYSNQVSTLKQQVDDLSKTYNYGKWWMTNTVAEVQQVYWILLQRDGDLKGMVHWLDEYTTRENLFMKVIADPSSGVQYLSGTTLFTRIYYSALQRYDGDAAQEIVEWAAAYENAVGFAAKAHVCEVFLGKVLAATTGSGDLGRSNLQFRVNSATESAQSRWLQDYNDINSRYEAAKSKMNAADEARRRAQNTLSKLPNSSQAEQAYRDADELYQRAAKEWEELRQKKNTAERTYNTAAGAASTAQGDYNRLNTGNTGGSAGNSDNLRIIASQARVAAEQARTLRDNAQAAVDSIQANLTGVRQITELYTLLFNRSNPLPTHLHYWLTDLKNGAALNEIAYSMYIDPNVLDRQLSSMGVDNFFKYIYEETLQRKDNDVKGWTHWVERFNAASTPAEKGNVIIGLIWSVKNDPQADGVPEALAARARFNQRVDSSVYDAVKNAQSYANTSDENYRRLNSQATVAEANYNASISNNTTLPVQTGNDMLSLVQVYRLLGGSESVTNATAAKLNDLVQDVRTGRKKINLARAELFRISAYAGLGSSAVLSSIYQNALGRSDNDMGGYWLPELDNARLTNNDEQLGQVLFNIVDKLYKEQIAGTPGFAGRKNFDAAVVRTLASLSGAETSLQSQALSTQSSLKQQVATAKAAVSALNGETNPQLANAVKAFSLSTAVNVEASAAETLIARVYALVLNRAVDEAGLAHWAAKATQQDNLSLIRDILSGAEARGELAPMGSAEFVDRLYQALGSIDANNSALHKAGLANGSLSRELVVQRVLDETLKNQASDIKGIQRQNMLVNKTSVALIYSKLMHGSGELNQARTVLARVSANDSAAGIASALASDPKVAARSHLAGLYQLLFGRTADLKGFIYWGKEVPAAGLEDASWSSFITKLIEGEQKPSDVKLKDLGDSAFINQLYRNALGREAEPAGLAYWIQSLQSSSRADVVRNFLLQLDYAAENANPDATVKLNFKLDQQVFSRRVASNLSQLLQEETSAISNLQQGNDNQLKDLQKAAALAASQASVAEQQVDQVLRQIGAPSWAASVAGLNLSSRTQLQSSQIQQIAGKDAIVIQERYDRWGNLLSQSDARYAGWQTSYRYDDQNRLIETVRQDGVRQTQAYNSLGQQIGQLDGNNNLNLSIRDAQGHLVRETHGDGSWINYRYNGFGELQEKQDAAQTIRYAYDDLGRLVQQTHMGVISVSEVASTAMHKGYAESYALPEKAQLQQRFVYDELGRRTEQIQEMLENGTAGNIVKGSQISQRTVYDLLGNAIEQDNSWHTRGGTANKTSRRFDALSREISRTDANTKTQSWSYDGTSARYKTYTDLGAHGYAYDYNFQGLLSKETGTVNSAKSISYTYTAQGQVSTINDAGTQTVSLYQYDEAGRRISEYVLQTQSGVKQTLQDNRLGYDEVGRLRVVETSRYRQEYGYDNNDNRVLQITGYYVNVREQLPFNGATSTPDKNENAMLRAVERRTISWNTYDAMNRQLIVDGIKIGDVISISGSQGHELAYDAAGRKVSDRYAGKTLDENGKEGMGYITEITDYDQLGRIKTISRDGLETGRVVIDEREYNQHNQLVRSGMNDAQVMKLMRNEGLRKAYEHIGVEGSSQLFSYSASTIASEAHLDDVSRVLRQQIHTTNQDQAYSNTMNIHDDAGNLIEYGQDGRQTYYYTYNNADQYDHYQNSQIRAVHRDAGEKTSTMKYDANGHLQSVDGAKEASIQYWTDTAGRVLRKQQGDTVTTTLLVNEQILGSSSEGLASVSSSDDIALFYRKEGIGRTSVYEVREGDSLTSIALSLYGDRSLWYKLAEANGLGAESQLSKGSLLQVPALEGSSNKAGEIKPYNSSKLIGDTNPEMPQPQNQDGGCGPVGAFLSAATFIALSFIVPGGGGLLYQAFTQAAIGAASSLVGQIGAVAAGEQKDINWKGVALSGISAGVSAGLGPNVFGLEAGGVANAMAKAAVTSTITQGIGVVTGLQPNFSWRGVAAAAVGAGVGHQVGGWLNKTDAFSSLGGGYATAVAQRSVSNFAEGVTTSLVRNGRVDVGQVAADAFGNALGDSLAARNSSIYSDEERTQRRQEINAANAQRSAAFNSRLLAEVQGQAASWVDTNSTALYNSLVGTQPTVDYSTGTYAGDEFALFPSRYRFIEGGPAAANIGTKDSISDRIRAETMIRLQREAQEFKAKNPRVINGEIYVDDPEGRPSIYVEIAGVDKTTLPDIELKSPSSLNSIISQQGQPTVYNDATGTIGWAVDRHDGDSLNLAKNFAGGLKDVAYGLTVGTYENATDLIAAGVSVLWNEAIRDTYNRISNSDKPMIFANVRGPVAEAYKNGASHLKLIASNVPVVNIGVMSYDATTAALNGDWNGLARQAGGLAGGMVVGKGVQKYGNYNVQSPIFIDRSKSGQLNSKVIPFDVRSPLTAPNATSSTRITPKDLGLQSFSEHPIFHRLWEDSMNYANRRSSAYKEYLGTLEKGETPSAKQARAAFDAVRNRFTVLAEKAGVDVPERIHHWNWPIGNFPTQAVNPSNLFPVSHEVHMNVHRAVTSGHTTKSPISPQHVLSLDEVYWLANKN